jgi:hypothetical protein
MLSNVEARRQKEFTAEESESRGGKILITDFLRVTSRLGGSTAFFFPLAGSTRNSCRMDAGFRKISRRDGR